MAPAQASPLARGRESRNVHQNSKRENVKTWSYTLRRTNYDLRYEALRRKFPCSYRSVGRANGNHLEICLSCSQKNKNSLTGVLVALTVCFTYPVLYRVSDESRAGEWELRVIDNEKSWSLRADARRRITLHYQTQVSLQETGSEPLGLGPVPLSKIRTHLLASLRSKGKNRNSLRATP